LQSLATRSLLGARRTALTAATRIAAQLRQTGLAAQLSVRDQRLLQQQEAAGQSARDLAKLAMFGFNKVAACLVYSSALHRLVLDNSVSSGSGRCIALHCIALPCFSDSAVQARAVLLPAC
jgi:hypothetical protein